MSRPMGASHTRFLQTMMTNGIISSLQAKTLHQHCCETHAAHYSADELEDFIELINMHIQPMFMQIRKGMSEEDGVQYYALVNVAESDIRLLSSEYADNELEILKKMMTLIVDSETGTASSTQILNSKSIQSKKMMKKDMENVLHKFVQDKWLCVKHGEYSLSTRSIIEMEPYLRAVYQELLNMCHVCHSIVFQNQQCENPSCGIRMHLPCVARYFKGQNNFCCPSCSMLWAYEIPEFQQGPESELQSLSASPASTSS